MSCRPLEYPPEWQAVVKRHFLLGFPVVGAQVAVYRAVCAQLAPRSSACWEHWGTHEPRLALARFASEQFGRAAEWPNPVFIPEDPFPLVAWNHRATAIDHLETADALRDIARHLGVKISRRSWEAVWSQSLGQVVDHLLGQVTSKGA